MGVNFIEEKGGEKDFGGVKSGEVVILPAFGASVHEMKLLADRNVQIVDTTCPWVSKARGAALRAHQRPLARLHAVPRACRDALLTRTAPAGVERG